MEAWRLALLRRIADREMRSGEVVAWAGSAQLQQRCSSLLAAWRRDAAAIAGEDACATARVLELRRGGMSRTLADE